MERKKHGGGYEIVGFEMLPVNSLMPHPDAESIPMDEEDRGNLSRSMQRNNAVFHPLLVSNAVNGDGKRLIIDGVNRWKILFARSADYQVVPCLLIRGSDAKEIIMSSLVDGRKRCTGQRIIAFLEMHKAEVLNVVRIIGNHDAHRAGQETRSGHMTGSVIPKELEGFTAEAIAGELGCSDKDVRAGIDLLLAMEAKELPASMAIQLPGRPKITLEHYREAVQAKRIRILQGSDGIRRWRAGVGGAAGAAAKVEQGGSGKAAADYGRLARPAAVTLGSAFERWGDIEWPIGIDVRGERWNERDRCLQAIGKAFAALPPDVRALAREIIVEQWPKHERERLMKGLAEKAREER